MGIILGELSIVYLQLKDVNIAIDSNQKALDLYRHLVEKEPSNTTYAAAADRAVVTLARAHASQGRIHYMMNNLEEARVATDRALEIDSDNPLAFFTLSELAFQKSDLPRVIEHLTRAIELEPGNAEYHQNRGISYNLMEKYASAIDDLTQVIAILPDDSSGYSSRAKVHEDQGQLDMALEDINHAVRLSPDLESVYRQRAGIHQKQGHSELAQQDLEKAIERGYVPPVQEQTPSP